MFSIQSTHENMDLISSACGCVTQSKDILVICGVRYLLIIYRQFDRHSLLY